MLDLDSAKDILYKAEKQNPGKWVKHSLNVAEAAKRLANELNLDTNRAYIWITT